MKTSKIVNFLTLLFIFFMISYSMFKKMEPYKKQEIKKEELAKEQSTQDEYEQKLKEKKIKELQDQINELKSDEIHLFIENK